MFLLVHSSDHTRLDIVMPGGRHIYLKASSTVERQQWVVALGTSKQDEEGTMEKCESLSWELVHMEFGIELCYSTEVYSIGVLCTLWVCGNFPPL